MSRKDFFDTCYAGPQRKLSGPEDFKRTYCNRCRNVECERSVVNDSLWIHRMDTQADRLLFNPVFANPSDPDFYDLRKMEFRDMVQKALRLEIASQRGDWEPVSEAEVREYAERDSTEANPAMFEDASEDLDRLAAEAEAALGVLEVPEAAEPEAEDEDGEPLWTVLIGKARYEVNLWDEGWTCTCKAFTLGQQNPCKHITEAQRLYTPPEPEPEPTPPPTPPKPQGPRVQPHIGGNTRFPSGGVMIDGTPPPSAPTTRPGEDPWAPKATNRDNVIKPGSKVILGGGSKE